MRICERVSARTVVRPVFRFRDQARRDDVRDAPRTLEAQLVVRRQLRRVVSGPIRKRDNIAGDGGTMENIRLILH